MTTPRKAKRKAMPRWPQQWPGDVIHYDRWFAYRDAESRRLVEDSLRLCEDWLRAYSARQGRKK